MLRTVHHVCLALLLSCQLTATTQAASYYVRMSGSDSNNGHNANQAFRTIQKAVTSATTNDTIYIGAGTYRESVYKNYSSSPGTLRIYGDTTGDFTGDKGPVKLEIPTGRWGLLFYYAQDVSVQNIDFDAELPTENSYGCYFYQFKGQMSFKDCSFQNLLYGSYCYNMPQSTVENCSFSKMYLSVYHNRAANSSVANCNFSDCRYGHYFVDVSSGISEGCSFTGSVDENGVVYWNYPYIAYRSALSVANANCERPTHGIYGTDFKSLDASDVTVSEPQGWGIHATGEDLTATNITVTGKKERRGWGVMLDDKTGKASKLTNVTVSGLYGGVAIYSGDYKFDNVASTSNYIGLYVTYYMPTYTFDGKDKFQLSDNYLGLYCVHNVGADGDLTVKNYDFENNDFPLYTVRANLDLQNCNFTQNATGPWIVHCKQATIKNCKVFENNARTQSYHYGMYVHGGTASISNCEVIDNDNIGIYTYGESASISNCEVTNSKSYGIYAYTYGTSASVVDCDSINNRIGLLVYNPGSEPATLRNLLIKDNAYMGIYAYYGTLALTAKDNVTISGSDYGIYSRFTDCKFDGLNAPTGCKYPLCQVDGSLDLNDTDVGEGIIGVYAVRMNPLKITNTTVHNQTAHGFYLYDPTSVFMSGCKSYENASHGLYCYMPAEGDKDYLCTDSSFSKNTYGYRTIGVPFDAKHVDKVSITDNNHGLRVENSTMQLTPDLEATIEGNIYGAMSYYGEMTVKDVTLKGNQVAVYNWDSSLDISNSEIAASNYGIISYAGQTNISDVVLREANYGLYFSPRTVRGNGLNLSNVTFDNIVHVSFYVYSVPDYIANVTAEDLQIHGSRYGVYSYNSNLDVKRTTVNAPQYYGIYQYLGTANYEDFTINDAGSWGVLTYGTSTTLNRAKVDSRYGVYLMTPTAKIVNSVIQDSVYGVYTNHADGDYQILQSTIGNISHYGVIHNQGTMTLRNSIVDANIYALWNRAAAGSLEHDHNLIVADNRSYVNELPGTNEIEKQPIFLDPNAGDLHLAAGSPAINAGFDLSDVAQADIEGNARPSFRQFEIGAYEFTDNKGSLRILDWKEQAK